MSFLETQVLGLAGTAVGKLLQIKPARRFEAFSDFCSITETHNIAVTATQYPIEDGNQGTDHIVREPKNITWDVIFGERSDPQGTYQRLLDLMYSGVPFTAVTGLRRYDNMLLVSVAANQDTHSARILKCTLTMQEIVITFPLATNMPPRSQQANPNVTAKTAQTGTKQLQEKTVKENTALRNVTNEAKKLVSL
jgi:hypothetical protein|nr:MAG TPA: hypothetical protein [Caudoviricetes sp.]